MTLDAAYDGEKTSTRNIDAISSSGRRMCEGSSKRGFLEELLSEPTSHFRIYMYRNRSNSRYTLVMRVARMHTTLS